MKSGIETLKTIFDGLMRRGSRAGGAAFIKQRQAAPCGAREALLRFKIQDDRQIRAEATERRVLQMTHGLDPQPARDTLVDKSGIGKAVGNHPGSGGKG